MFSARGQTPPTVSKHRDVIAQWRPRLRGDQYRKPWGECSALMVLPISLSTVSGDDLWWTSRGLRTTQPGDQCVGEFRYRGMHTGETRLKCSNGAGPIVRFNAFSPLSGYGNGTISEGPASFTHGLKASDAVKHLRFPPGTGPDLLWSKPPIRSLTPRLTLLRK